MRHIGVDLQNDPTIRALKNEACNRILVYRCPPAARTKSKAKIAFPAVDGWKPQMFVALVPVCIVAILRSGMVA